MAEVFVVGLAGGTASGKTTLAKRLFASAEPGEAQILPLDAFYLDGDDFPPAIRHPAKNFDHPDALDFEGFCAAIDTLRSGHAVDIPVYDFVTHTRTGGEELSPAPILIVEGILVLVNEEVRSRLNTSVFCDVPSEVRFNRRLDRDVAERGRTPESVAEQWNQTVAPMYEQFVEPSKEFAEVVSDGTDFEQVIRDLLARSRR